MTANTTLTIADTQWRLMTQPHPKLGEVPLILRSWAEHHQVLRGRDLLAFEAFVSSLCAAWAAFGWTQSTTEAWILTPDDLDERHDRRAVARSVLLVIAQYSVVVDPDWALVPLPDRTSSQRRPLSCFEHAACRTVVETAGPKTPELGAVLSLCEAGAGSFELAKLLNDELDLRARKVALPGTPGRTDPRTSSLDAWQTRHLGTYAAIRPTAWHGPGMPALYNGTVNPQDTRSVGKAASNLGMRVTAILRLAGIDADDVAPESIRNTVALGMYHNENPTPPQRFLGCRSTDQTLREIGILPHKPERKRKPKR